MNSIARHVAETLVTLGLTAIVACSSGPTTLNSGSLTVTITAPTGILPAVRVSGPGQYTKTLSSSTTLTHLAPGDYTVTTTPVTLAGPIVSTVNTAAVSGNPATVSEAATATITATYTQRPGTGGLFVAPFSYFQPAVEYSAAQLATSTFSPPAFVLTTPNVDPLNAAFDTEGNLWVTTFGSSTVVEYAVSQLASPAPHTPTGTLSANAAGSLSLTEGLAFDASGNLWIANLGSSMLVEFTRQQLGSSGSPSPAVTISPPPGSWNSPAGLAFDAGGNLWVTAQSLNPATESEGILEFTRNQLVASGSPTPAVTISPIGTPPEISIDGAQPLAFDAHGNLWIANAGNSSVVEFSAEQLTSSGAPIPAVFLAPRDGSLAVPTGLAFDNSGNLWVANSGSGKLVRFNASQLVADGTPTPIVTIDNKALAGAFGIAFDPPPATLPLKQ